MNKKFLKLVAAVLACATIGATAFVGCKPKANDGGKTDDTTVTDPTKPADPDPTKPTTPAAPTAPVITKASSGEFETAYVEWTVKETEGVWFNVYYAAQDGEKWNKLDAPLVRQYKDYFRADTVGLKAGEYKMKVVPVVGGAEVKDEEAVEENITVKSHDRSGYAFADSKVPGAYNLDGTLKTGAKVVYVTAATAKTVTCTVLDKGKPVNCTGFQTILDERQGSGDTTPLCFRIVGTVTKDDLDHISSSAEGLQIKEASNITVEGIGNDATIWGFGILLRSVTESEVRNVGIMNFMDDGISIDTDNKYLWIHNNDFFYGGQGGDADQAKGDGSLDTKGSTHMTHSYNHFWDSGKCNLQGMKTEDPSYKMTYHHNWYDHSDSRHPRVRTATVHVYNNYFDGNSKYGVGATTGASVFVEANYFRSTSSMRPMMSSMQGTDAQGDGTFSGEDGGIIKSLNNVYDTAGGGKLNLRTYQEYGQSSDCYQVNSREEVVPSSVTTVQGGTTYNNFDTAADFYKYEVETAEQARDTVKKYAGRLEGGDFKWEFTAADDASYAVDAELKAAILAYETSVIKIGGVAVPTGGSGGEEGGDTPQPSAPIEGSVTIYCNKTDESVSANNVTITGNATSKYEVTFGGKTYRPLKMESATNITLALSGTYTIEMYMTLSSANTALSGKDIKVNGTAYTSDESGIAKATGITGSVSITKGDSCCLCYIVLTKTA